MAGNVQPHVSELNCWFDRAVPPLDRPLVFAEPPRPDQWLQDLARTIEIDVVPRLGTARSAGAGRTAGSRKLDAAAVAAFVGSVLDDEAAAETVIADLQAQGHAVETIYLDLLAPAARLLGDYWVSDRCTFAEVTLALWRMQRLLHDLGAAFRADNAVPEPRRSVLLVAVPGEQHTFGLLMLSDFFARAGWSVRSMPLASRAHLGELVAAESFAVVGISMAGERQLDALRQSIRAVRRLSRNPHVGVMVGGPFFVDHPDCVAQVGADLTATDGRDAPMLAQALVARLGARQAARVAGEAAHDV